MLRSLLRWQPCSPVARARDSFKVVVGMAAVEVSRVLLEVEASSLAVSK